jgi:hypothetical protein
MNPADNRENLSDDYMIRLGTLSERAKRRMLYGEWVKPEGAVYEEFAERHIIPKDKVPPIERYCVGIDFGLQCAGVLVGWAGDRAYIIDDYGALGFTAQMLNNEITRKWGNLQWIAWCDPSGGERLFEIFNSSEANNAVEPGIDFIQTLIHNDQFFVVDTCRGVLSEIWDYRRDEKGRVVKENDHYCFVGVTQILSGRGWVPLWTIKPYDKVLTRDGWKNVKVAERTAKNAQLWEVKLSNGQKLYGTKNHPIFTKSGVKISIDALRYGIILDTWEENKWLKKSSIMASLLNDTPNQKNGLMLTITDRIQYIYKKVLKLSTVKYGATKTVQFLKDIVYTIKTKILRIMISIILFSLHVVNIKDIILKGKLPKEKMKIWQESDLSPQYGIIVNKGKNGIQSMEKRLLRNKEKHEKTGKQTASSAVKNMNSGTIDKNIVTLTVKQKPSVYVVSSKPISHKADVYNLCVEDAHEYYANGVLVSNCDAMRYAIFSERGIPLQIFIK